MAALTRLTLLSVILIIILGYCSFKQSTTNDAIELNQSKISTAKAEEKHDRQIDNANTGASNARANDFIRADSSDESKSSRLQEVHRGKQPEKESVKRSKREVSTRQAKDKIKNAKEAEMKRREKGGMTHDERKVVLVLHNNALNSLEYSATNMEYMVYNAQLERVALLWTKQCDSMAEFPLLNFNNLQFNEGALGLNADANETYDWEMILNLWISGYTDYDRINSQCSNGTGYCEHYVRMVWHNTNYLGCASYFCPEYYREQERMTNMFNYACYYTPTGNTRPAGILRMQMAPYIRGKAASECPPGNTYIWGNFCRTDPPCKNVRECKYPRNIETCLCNETFYDSGQESIVLCWKLLDFAVILVAVAFSSTNM